MGYDACIAAAGTPVLEYYEEGSYQGDWYAYTAKGFYTGSYGSCSGCDWRENELSKVDYEDRDRLTAQIDAGIGRKIMEKPAMTLDELLVELDGPCAREPIKVERWARKAVRKHLFGEDV